ncbi:hypothetical protein GGR28_001752 [Lewinella aquimaris]|uniref:Long-chain fatty acid transport protein n=1 Tax=Neolewinella aquimaris TaxID=1835722 RepID=A0A840E689_9BACT|nr:hypothetical protein [Neolewinella aquimaris]MBB4079135.1 hypothetical protein [Neolewinella aquimaris]
MKSLLSAAFVLLTLGVVSGQSYTDVFRYSFISPQGSARFAGTGGSLTPMGVDATTLHTNPAGIGWNRYNMAQVTPGFSFTGTDALLGGEPGNESLSESAATFTLPSMGVILAGNTRSVNWSTLNFGISMTRLADFNQQYRFSGRSPGSIIEGFAELLDIGESDPFGADLAEPFVIYEEGTNRIRSDFFDFAINDNRNDPIQRDGLYDRRGSMNEVAIGFGGNYREKFLWGLSVGIPFFSYKEDFTYEEIDDERLIPSFENLAYIRNITSSGAGFNLKAGVNFLPTEQLRFSAAIHTPTFWSIDDRSGATFTYVYTDVDGTEQGGTEVSDIQQLTYNLQTPWKFMVGAGVLVGKTGFISVDADYSDFTSNQISFDDFATANAKSEAVNADVDAILGSSIGLRVGGELNLTPVQLRAGVGYRQVPYANYAEVEDQSIMTYSAGAGYSLGKFFVDLAAQVEQPYATFEEPYETLLVTGQTLTTDRTRVSVLLTVGFRGFTAGF